jgi:hypothetical protein
MVFGWNAGELFRSSTSTRIPLDFRREFGYTVIIFGGTPFNRTDMAKILFVEDDSIIIPNYYRKIADYCKKSLPFRVLKDRRIII